ncbi:uncharacterized protein [Arachis hypogaea]|uniref:uncharacterized protein n=1 Tax=Arachis hypogaea TaxID=3818 RepID=UPI003B20B773
MHVSKTARPKNEDHNPENSPGPFTTEVMNFVLPRRFTLPTTLTPYDGLGDPKKYIKKFTSIMIVNGSISRFRDLSKPFEKHFVGSAIYLHDSDYLNTIKQGQHESLRDYMTRFTKIAVSILDLHPEVELHVIKSGLQPGKFQETIAVAKPKTMAEFREKAKATIQIQRVQIYCTFHQKHGDTTDECVIAKDLLEQLTRQSHLDKYIGDHIQQRAPPPGDQSSAAQYSRDKDRTNTNPPDQSRRIINCISGGFASGGATSLARKRSYRAMLSIEASQNHHQTPPHFPQITFEAFNFNTNVTNLDDPVVISLQLGDLLVKKVLLDPGSSADVLFYSTFQKMKLSNNILQPSTGDLVGFSGERVLVMGSVWFRTTLGEDNTITTIHSDAREARECYNNSFKRPNRSIQAYVHNIGNQDKLPVLANLDPRAGILE